MSGSAKSALFMTTTDGFWPMRLAIMGLVLLMGMRASTSSMTTSMTFRFASISRLAFAMWPGYQLIIITYLSFVCVSFLL